MPDERANAVRMAALLRRTAPDAIGDAYARGPEGRLPEDLAGGGTWEYPQVILPETITGDNETAQTDDWDRTDQGDSDGVTIKVQTRAVYNAAGDTILYGFHRALTFDSAGALVTISAETRYTIDEPAACP